MTTSDVIYSTTQHYKINNSSNHFIISYQTQFTADEHGQATIDDPDKGKDERMIRQEKKCITTE